MTCGLRFLLELFGLLVAMFAAPAIGMAHPDIAMTARVSFKVDQGHLAGFSQQWAFDAGYSRALMARFDTDRDGALSETETATLRDRLIADLSPFGYFAELYHDADRLPLGEPAALVADVVDATVIVTMGFALLEPIDLSTGGRVEAILLDRDYIAAIQLSEEQPARVEGDGSRNCTTSVRDRTDKAYFGRLVVPQAVLLVCR